MFTFAADQPGSTFECSVDGADFVPVRRPHASRGRTRPGSSRAARTSSRSARPTRSSSSARRPSTSGRCELGPDVTEPNSTIISGPENGTLLAGSDLHASPAPTTGLSPPTSRSSARSTRRPSGTPARRRSSSPTSPAASTPSASARSTRPATSSRRPDVYTWMVVAPPLATILSGPGVDAGGVDQPDGHLHVLERRSGRDVRVLARRAVQPAAGTGCASGVTYREPRPRRPPVRGARRRRVRQPRACGRTRSSVVLPPRRSSRRRRRAAPAPRPTFEFTSEPLDPDADVLLLARRRAVRVLRLAEDLHAPLAGPAHVPGADRVHRRRLDGSAARVRPRARDATRGRSSTSRRPTRSIDFGPPATTTSISAYIGVSSDDPTATIECTLDGAVRRVRARRRGRAHRPRRSGRTRSPPSPPTRPATSTRRPSRPPVDDRGAHRPGRTRRSGTNVVVTLPLPGGAGTPPSRSSRSTPPARRRSTSSAAARPCPTATAAAACRSSTSRRRPSSASRSRVCLNYDPADYGGPTPSVRLLHFDGELWLDITIDQQPVRLPGAHLRPGRGLLGCSRSRSPRRG